MTSALGGHAEGGAALGLTEPQLSVADNASDVMLRLDCWPATQAHAESSAHDQLTTAFFAFRPPRDAPPADDALRIAAAMQVRRTTPRALLGTDDHVPNARLARFGPAAPLAVGGLTVPAALCPNA